MASLPRSTWLVGALAFGLAHGVSAQSSGVITGDGYSVSVLESDVDNGGIYTYDYALSLAPSSTPGAYVNGLLLTSPGGQISPINTPTITDPSTTAGPSFPNGTPDAVTTDGILADFTSATGLTASDPTATISFQSALAPVADAVFLTGAGSAPGTGTFLDGPGMSVGNPISAFVSTSQTESVLNGIYTDTVTETLLPTSAPGAFVDGFLFTSPAGNINGLLSPTASGAGFNGVPDDSTVPTVTDFSAVGGLTAADPTAVFTFQSTAPIGPLGVTAAGSGPVTISTAVPESSAVPLLALGLLPMGLTLCARRRRVGARRLTL